VSVNLNPDKALIFRIVHVENLPWILDHNGLYCPNSPNPDPQYVNIGNADLIGKRANHRVSIAPGGTLNDYVPFYFTPFSMMMYNIHTGRGVKQRDNCEIIIFVSSVHRLRELNIPFVFTNQHAYAAGTNFYSDVAHLSEIDWSLLQSRNFKTDDADPGKGLRYQAEVLVHQHLPLAALLGICCNDGTVKKRLDALLAERNQQADVKIIPGWYF
jgi:hypothetical protein